MSMKTPAVEVLSEHHRNPKALVTLVLPGGLRVAVLCTRHGKRLCTQTRTAAAGSEGVILPPLLRQVVDKTALGAALADPLAGAHLMRPQAEIERLRAAPRRGEAA